VLKNKIKPHKKPQSNSLHSKNQQAL
jgi:hypothetical protein